MKLESHFNYLFHPFIVPSQAQLIINILFFSFRKMNRLLLLFTAILFCSCTSILQKQGQKNYTPVIVQDKEYQAYNKYQKDFIHLAALCEEGFPLIDNYFPEKERKAKQQKIIEKLGHQYTDDKIFTLEAISYLASFRNQHTSIRTGVNFRGTFPFLAHSQDSSWYVRNISTSFDSTLIGRRIISINQEPVASFAHKAGKLLPTENKISERKGVENRQLLNRSEVLWLSGIIPQPDSLLMEVEGAAPFWLYNVTDNNSLNLFEVSDRPHSITAPGDRHIDYQLFPEQDIAYLQIRRFQDRADILDVMKTYLKPWLQPFARFYLKKQFKKKEPSKMLRPYYDPQRPSMKGYLTELMEALDSLQTNHLIIDLRNNPGGNLVLGKQLMYYLTTRTDLKDFQHFIYTSGLSMHFQQNNYQQFLKNYQQLHQAIPEPKKLYPFPENSAGNDSFFDRITNPASPYYISPDRKVFKGRVYVLADYSSESAAALLTTLLQDNGLATVIGTSVSNNPTGPTTYTPYELPRTKAKGTIASNFLSRPDSGKPAIQKPDYWVEPGLEDQLQGRDPAWELALKLIEADKKAPY